MNYETDACNMTGFIYSFDELIDKIDTDIRNLDKYQGNAFISKMFRRLNIEIKRLSNLSLVFKEYFKKVDGKYLIFITDWDYFLSVKDSFFNNFSLVNNNLMIEYISPESSIDEKKYVLDRFFYVKDNRLKILCTSLVDSDDYNNYDGAIIFRNDNNIDCYNDVLNLYGVNGFMIDIVSSYKFSNSILFDRYEKVFSIVNDINMLLSYSWDQKYKLLSEYVLKYNKFPRKNNGFIGMFLYDQRCAYKNGELSLHCLEKMNLLGNWFLYAKSGLDDNWNSKYEVLREYVINNNFFPTLDVPIIGSWLGTQKQLYKNGMLSRERASKLDLLGNWNFDIRCFQRDNQWNEKYKLLEEYININKKIPSLSVPVIGSWLGTQKQLYKNGMLDGERFDKLNSLGCFMVDAQKQWDDELDYRWSSSYNDLKEYVLKNHKFPSKSEKIGIWLKNQRQAYRKGKLSSEREYMLDLLGDWCKKDAKIYDYKDYFEFQ